MTNNSPVNDLPHSRRSSYPLRDNWIAIVFMIALLLASGVTASVVGYKIKVADTARKAELFEAYSHLGGDRDRLVNIEQSMVGAPLSPPQSMFLSVYEINERSRSFGLYRWMEFAKAETVASTIQALDTIGATDPARIVEASWAAMKDATDARHATHPHQGPVNAKAARISKKYGRHAARDVETKLYRFLTDHKEEIFAHR